MRRLRSVHIYALCIISASVFVLQLLHPWLTPTDAGVAAHQDRGFSDAYPSEVIADQPVRWFASTSTVRLPYQGHGPLIAEFVLTHALVEHIPQQTIIVSSGDMTPITVSLTDWRPRHYHWLIDVQPQPSWAVALQIQSQETYNDDAGRHLGVLFQQARLVPTTVLSTGGWWPQYVWVWVLALVTYLLVFIMAGHWPSALSIALGMVSACSAGLWYAPLEFASSLSWWLLLLATW